jgi:hypothetical protein
MNIQFQTLTSLSVDFDDLYESSLPDINNNFLWAPHLETDEQRKEFYKEQLLDAIAGNCPFSNDNEFLMYRVQIDGVDHLLAAGYIEAETRCFKGHWYLTKKYNNSRSWIFAAETAPIRAAFFAQHNIETYKAPTHTDSAFYAALKRNSSDSIIDEVPSFEGAPSNYTALVGRL